MRFCCLKYATLLLKRGSNTSSSVLPGFFKPVSIAKAQGLSCRCILAVANDISPECYQNGQRICDRVSLRKSELNWKHSEREEELEETAKKI